MQAVVTVRSCPSDWQKSCILNLLNVYPGICTWSPRLHTGIYTSTTRTRIWRSFTHRNLRTVLGVTHLRSLCETPQHHLMVKYVWVWNHSLSQYIWLVAGYGFNFMACDIPNANHFPHADVSDHSLNAMVCPYSLSKNIFTIYVKLSCKWYTIIDMIYNLLYLGSLLR